ncbi:hypothetical protein C8T65DRAFT_694888 [Cerioporus squamosus]|nr:hypothetical protein C8T65DRAFT_694888 [Cerioporus squamosus]
MPTTELEDVPVATDDETTQRGTQEPENGGRDGRRADNDDSLPPSSPIESWTEDEADGPRSGQVYARETTAESYGTADMWSAVGPAPATHLFNEHEAGPREEGEVDEMTTAREDEPVYSDEERELSCKRAEKWEDFLSKHPSEPILSDRVMTPRKCSWTGSVVSEERNRSSRRPRREEDGEKGVGFRLPSIHELVGNPWGISGNERGGRISLHAPVYMFTPRQNKQPPLTDHVYQSGANVSGHAPTPHSVSTVASAIHSYAKGAAAGERAGEHGKRAVPRALSQASYRTSAMDIEEEEESSLLRTPDQRQARREQNRRELVELEERRHALMESLRETEEDRRPEPRTNTPGCWPGGYAPEKMSRGQAEADEVPRRAIDDLVWRENEMSGQRDNDEEGSVEGEDQLPGERWSAVPNTKAWLYSEKCRAYDQGWIEEPPMRDHDESRPAERCTTADTGSRPTMAIGRDGSCHSTRRDESSMRRGGENYGQGEGEEPMVYERTGWADATTEARRGPGVGGAIPTVVTCEEGVADLPVTVEDPHDEKWTVHFEDPETLLRGQSADFIKVVWWGQEPTVIFTVYNYKYTENDATNRHIETSVSGMTTMITGETGFHVIPPDPEWRRQLTSRDLPFTWAIRGLSEAGAWEMVKVRVATSKGVTIITYPRSLKNPRWVCGLVGFLRPDADAIKTAVLGTLRSEYMLERLADLTRSNNLLSHIPEGRRAEHVLRSLEIKVMATREGAYVANIYILPPSDGMDAWREWVEEIRAHRYNSFLCGAGVARRIFWCAGCRGVDHEEEDCPFPKMRGWKGPDAGAGTHTRLQIMGVTRGGAGRGRGGAVHGMLRKNGQQGQLGAGSEHGNWWSQSGHGRASGTGGRGGSRGHGKQPTGGLRGMKRGAWSPMIRR